MSTTRVGLVGLGWISQVVHLPILKKLPEAELVSVCDLDPSRLRGVAEKFGIKRTYTDISQMLAQEELEAVIVATSTDAHKDATIACLRAGKDVLVEKPMARTHAESVAMVDAAKEAKRKLMVGMNHRFRPDTMILKGMIEEQELGKVLYTRCGWLRRPLSDGSWLTQKEKSGGGVFLDLGIMMLDLSLWMMGYPDVKRVSGSSFHHRTKKVEDTALASLVLKNGSTAWIEVSWSMCLDDDVYYCHVYGTDGSASLNPFRINKEVAGNIVNLTPAKMESGQNIFRRSYENELRHFLGAVRGLHQVVSTGEESVHRMKIVEAIYKSMRLGKEVTIP